MPLPREVTLMVPKVLDGAARVTGSAVFIDQGIAEPTTVPGLAHRIHA